MNQQENRFPVEIKVSLEDLIYEREQIPNLSLMEYAALLLSTLGIDTRDVTEESIENAFNSLEGYEQFEKFYYVVSNWGAFLRNKFERDNLSPGTDWYEVVGIIIHDFRNMISTPLMVKTSIESGSTNLKDVRVMLTDSFIKLLNLLLLLDKGEKNLPFSIEELVNTLVNISKSNNIVFENTEITLSKAMKLRTLVLNSLKGANSIRIDRRLTDEYEEYEIVDDLAVYDIDTEKRSVAWLKIFTDRYERIYDDGYKEALNPKSMEQSGLTMVAYLSGRTAFLNNVNPSTRLLEFRNRADKTKSIILRFPL